MAIERHEVTDRASWLALRMQDLTASDIAAVAGLDPNRSPLRVHVEKAGLVPPPEDNLIMRRGRWLEPAVIEALRDERPTWDIKRAGVYLRDPDIRMGATPDAVAIDPKQPGIGAVQCKVVSRSIFERDWIDGRAPLKFQVQTLAEAMLVEAAWAVVAALVIDTYSAELVVDHVPRHGGAEERIRETVQKFWADMAAGRQPAAVYSQDAEVIAALHPKGGAEPVDLSQHNRIAFLCEERLAWQKRKTSSENALEVVDAEITDILGDADQGQHPQFNITWKLQKRKETLIPASEYRVLRLTRKGKG